MITRKDQNFPAREKRMFIIGDDVDYSHSHVTALKEISGQTD